MVAPLGRWLGRCPVFASGLDGLAWRAGRAIARLLCCAMPDEQVFWVLRSYLRTRRLVRREGVDVIFSTFSPASNLLLGWLLKRATGAVWVADFRDLWTDDCVYVGGSWLRRWVDRTLQRRFLRDADAVVAVSEAQRRILADHIPDQRHKFVTITNGVDLEDFDVSDIDPPTPPASGGIDAVANRTKKRQRFVVAHVGQLQTSRLTGAYVEGFKRFIQRLGGERRRLEFRLVGLMSARLRERFNSVGVEPVVTGYVPHPKAIKEMLRADVLLLPTAPGDNGASLIPAKVFEYLASGRPILVVGEPDCEPWRLVGRLVAGVRCDRDAESIEATLTRLWHQWADGMLPPGCKPVELTPHSRETLTRKLAALFDALCRRCVPGQADAKTTEPQALACATLQVPRACVRSGARNRAATVRERFSADDTAPLPYGRGSDKTSHTRPKKRADEEDISQAKACGSGKAGMNSPTVSVIIPTYNRAALLPRAVRSVIAQSFTDWELIIVDDGSTDDTRPVLSGFTSRLGSRLVVIHHANAGSSAARNRGIDAARGRFVAFLDSDDEYRPNKLARQLDLFRRCPQVGLTYSDYAYVDLEGRHRQSVFATISPRARRVECQYVAAGLYECGPDFFDELIQEYFIATITGMVRREVLGDGIRFPVGLSYAEEWLFYLQIAQKTRVGFVDEPLCLHHWVRGSLARTDVKQNLLGMARLLAQLPRLIPNLAARHRRAVRHNFARTALQLGYEFHREGRFREAASWFGRSFLSEPGRSPAKGAALSLAGRFLRGDDDTVGPSCGPSSG